MNRRGNARRAEPRSRATYCAAAAFGVLAGACGPDVWGDSAVKSVEPPRPEEVKHQPCDSSVGEVQPIASAPGAHPTVTRAVDSSGKEICRVVDFDQNGKPDLYQYFDGAGALVRQEMAYDGTGNITAVEFYEAGRLARRELDLSGAHRIDTWEYFDKDAAPDPKTGKLRPSRVERDTRGQGHVNEWWTWSGDKLTIVKDVKGDGKPDPSTTVVVGGTPEAPGASAKGDAGIAAPDAGTSEGGAAVAAPPAASASPSLPPAAAPVAPTAPSAAPAATPTVPTPPAADAGATAVKKGAS